MGLTIFNGDKPLKSDVAIAKNYLTENELAVLNRMVSAFFDLAELRAMNREPMYMKDWLIQVDNFVQMYGKGILPDAGTISHKQALEKAEAEYAKYRKLTADEVSPVERHYLDRIKIAQKQIEEKK